MMIRYSFAEACACERMINAYFFLILLVSDHLHRLYCNCNSEAMCMYY